MRYPGFAGGSSGGLSRIKSGERCVNMFPHHIERQKMLYPAPGLLRFATFPQGVGRGCFEHNDRIFAAFGDRLYEVDPTTGTPTEIGTLIMDSSPVMFETNGDGGNQLVASSGGSLNVLDLVTNVYTQNVITMSHFVGQVDGFLLSLDTTTSTIRASDIYAALTWSGLQTAQRSSASDPWRAMACVGREIYLIGEKTGEVYYNAGRPRFPFGPRSGTFFETGIMAPYSLSPFGTTLAWLGRSRHGSCQVFWLNGYYPDPISTPELEWAIQQYQDTGDITDTVGWSYEREGHKFYVLNFRTAMKTWVFDATTRKWHERGKWVANANDFQTYRAQFHCVSRGRNLVCDPQGNKMYQFSSSTFTDVDGDPLRRLRRMPMVESGLAMVNYKRVELDCMVGVGTGAGQASDPEVVLQASDDGGHTFGFNQVRKIGKVGEFATEVVWNAQGRSNRRVFDLWSSDPVMTVWFDLYINGRER